MRTKYRAVKSGRAENARIVRRRRKRLGSGFRSRCRPHDIRDDCKVRQATGCSHCPRRRLNPGRRRYPQGSAADTDLTRARKPRALEALMHRYRTHNCGALRAEPNRLHRQAFGLVSPHPRPWRPAVHRPARPLRPDPGGGRPGFAGLRDRRKAALGMGRQGRRPGAGAPRRHREPGPADRRRRGLRHRDRGAGPGGRAAAAGVRRPGLSRGHPAQVPLPRPAPRAAAPQHHAARRHHHLAARGG